MKNYRTVFILISFSFTFCAYSLGQIKNLNGEKISSIEIDNFIKVQMDSLQMPGLSICHH